MFQYKDFLERNLYSFSLILMAIGLSCSNALMSIAQMGIGIAFFGSLHFLQKIKRAQKEPYMWIWLGVFLWHIVGVFYSENQVQAWADIRIKIPLFTFAVAFATMPKISQNQLKVILRVFVISCVIVALIGFFKFIVKKYNSESVDFRSLSPFISHIRFSIMISFSLLILALGFIKSKEKYQIFPTALSVTIFAFLLVFLLMLKSITGILIFLIVGAFLLIYLILKSESKKLKWISFAILTGIPLIIIVLVSSFWQKYFVAKDHISDSITYTLQGNSFNHYPEREGRENGYLIWMNVNEQELQMAWDSVSKVPFWSVSNAGYNMDITIIRYLSSKGLTKEAASVYSLEKDEIDAIENGCANYLYKSSLSPAARLHQTIWEINDYLKYGDPNDKSLVMRAELWKTAIFVIKQNIWWGVGTGDVKEKMLNAFELNNSKLQEGYRLRPHNQYLTIGIALGIFALIMFPLAILLPMFNSYKTNFLFTIFCAITLLSMVNEDTLETQAGASFISFFYCLLLYGVKSQTAYKQ